MEEVEKLNGQLKKAEQKRDSLGEQIHAVANEIDDLTTKRDKARTATFDKGLVKEARDKGVNPHNFETEDQLREAVAIGVEG